MEINDNVTVLIVNSTIKLSKDIKCSMNGNEEQDWLNYFSFLPVWTYLSRQKNIVTESTFNKAVKCQSQFN